MSTLGRRGTARPGPTRPLSGTGDPTSSARPPRRAVRARSSKLARRSVGLSKLAASGLPPPASHDRQLLRVRPVARQRAAKARWGASSGWQAARSATYAIGETGDRVFVGPRRGHPTRPARIRPAPRRRPQRQTRNGRSGQLEPEHSLARALDLGRARKITGGCVIGTCGRKNGYPENRLGPPPSFPREDHTTCASFLTGFRDFAGLIVVPDREQFVPTCICTRPPSEESKLGIQSFTKGSRVRDTPRGCCSMSWPSVAEWIVRDDHDHGHDRRRSRTLADLPDSSSTKELPALVFRGGRPGRPVHVFCYPEFTSDGP